MVTKAAEAAKQAQVEKPQPVVEEKPKKKTAKKKSED